MNSSRPRRICSRPLSPSSSRASTQTWANGWTVGSRADAARPAMIGASFASACRDAFAVSSSTRAISRATILSNARLKHARSRGTRMPRWRLIRRIEVDTAHFKGNFPESCSLEGRDVFEGEPWDEASDASPGWQEILRRTPLQAHTRHYFEDELKDLGPITHLRFNIYPDGGVSRLRVMGTIKERQA